MGHTRGARVGGGHLIGCLEEDREVVGYFEFGGWPEVFNGTGHVCAEHAADEEREGGENAAHTINLVERNHLSKRESQRAKRNQNTGRGCAGSDRGRAGARGGCGRHGFKAGSLRVVGAAEEARRGKSHRGLAQTHHGGVPAIEEVESREETLEETHSP